MAEVSKTPQLKRAAAQAAARVAPRRKSVARAKPGIVARTMMVEGIADGTSSNRYHDLALAQFAEAAAPRLATPEPRSISPNPADGDFEGKFFASQPLEIT